MAMAMSEQLRDALEDYDRNAGRPRVAALVKQLRERGVQVTLIRESLDAAGVPVRLELVAADDVVWQYTRLDVALDQSARRASPSSAPPGPEKPAPGEDGAEAERDEETGAGGRGGRFACF